ncbi:MAG: hypothetical protein ABNG98_05530 [Flavobacterium sp.]|jgi:hypothetical protein
MKKIYLLTIFSLALFSCSSDNNDNSNNQPNFNLPVTIGNYWVYDVEGETTTTKDSLFISRDTIIGSNTYKKFETENNLATGFYSSSLKNNGVREFQNKLLLTGDLSLGNGQLPVNFDLSLIDFVIFKANASENEVLATKTGVINETVNGYPITINYTLKSKAGESLTQFTSPNNDEYNNVKVVKIILNATISTTLNGITVPIITNQDILTSLQYAADGIGVVHTNTIITYTISQFVANELGVPATSTQEQNEFLTNYFVQ